MTGADGNGSFNVTLPKVITGRFITATATDAAGNTSEFSDAIESSTAFPSETYVVTNTNDSGPGSLRAAILANNDSIAGANNTISFAIPGDGPHRIVPASGALPEITHAATIDGFTQTGSSANTLAVGNDSVLKIIIAGDSQPFVPGLEVRGRNSILRGLSIKGFTVEITIFADDVSVTGCWLGVLPDGTSSGQQFTGLLINDGADRTIIGGTAAGERNVVSGHNGYGLRMLTATSGARIQGNYFGVTPSGAQARSNGSYNIQFGGRDHLIGGSAAGAGNVISGAFNGLSLYEAQNAVIQGNYIGTDATGLVRMGGTGSVLNSRALPREI